MRGRHSIDRKQGRWTTSTRDRVMWLIQNLEQASQIPKKELVLWMKREGLVSQLTYWKDVRTDRLFELASLELQPKAKEVQMETSVVVAVPTYRGSSVTPVRVGTKLSVIAVRHDEDGLKLLVRVGTHGRPFQLRADETNYGAR